MSLQLSLLKFIFVLSGINVLNAFEFDVYIYSRGGQQEEITDKYGGGVASQIMYIDSMTQTPKSSNLITDLTAGVNVVVFNEIDSTFIESQSFYKWNEDTECAQYLSGLPQGRIVLISVYDTAELFDTTTSILQSWGCPSDTSQNVGWLCPFIFVGTSGLSSPWTYCETASRDSLPLNRTFTLPFIQTHEPTEDPTMAPTAAPLDFGDAGLYCSDTVFSDSLIAANPGISSLSDEASLVDKIEAGYSKLVDVPTMGYYDASQYVYEREYCPHLWIGLTRWEDVFPGIASGDITIPLNTRVILTKCSLDLLNNFGAFDRIIVPASSQLIFDDSEIILSAKEILVEGVLWIGSALCRLYSKITINFLGEKSESNIQHKKTGDLNLPPSKGLVVQNGGVLEMHGKEYVPTWTRLARTVNGEDDIIYLQDCVNWEVGMRILLTTTVWFDCHDDYKDTYCLSDYSWISTTYGMPHQNEIFEILAIESCNVLQINGTVNYTHFASAEYQGEVALLDRRIKVNGVKTQQSETDGFGAHMQVIGSSIGRIRGVQCTNCGQLNVLGRYPFHFHILGGGSNARQSYMTDNVVLNSNYRCYVVHGTNNTLLTRNVAHNVNGMCVYLEDGVEENNTLSYNLVSFIHPISEPADCCGQGGEDFVTSTELTFPADATAGGYYLPNAYNTLIGNVASGGWSGFIFPNVPLPLGEFHGVDNGWNNPIHRPVQTFYGNTAHSSGFYWKGQGSCMYVGAWLTTTDASVDPPILQYDSGRNSRDTKYPNGTRKWMLFEHTKAFLCMFGVSHWGNELIVEHYEVSDSLISAQFFGEGVMYNAVITGRTDNEAGWIQQQHHYADRIGFRFYDTWVKTIISHIQFRNYMDYTMDYIIKYLDHSDQFLPQGINAVKDISFDNVNLSLVIGIDNCGQSFCKNDKHETVASQIYNILDWDGSLSLAGKATLIGSYRNWWNVGDDCSYNQDWHIWYCDWTGNRQIAYLDLVQPGINDHGCDPILTNLYKPAWCTNDSVAHRFGTCNCSETSQFTAYWTAYVSQWGVASDPDTMHHDIDTKSIEMHGWPGISGIANTGWYWRPYWGAPDRFEIGSVGGIQLARGYFVILAVKYPANTVFNVSIYSNWAGQTVLYLDESPLDDVLQDKEELVDAADYNCSVYTEWHSLCADTVNGGFVDSTGGVGPSWHFDGTYLLIRVVTPHCYSYHTEYAAYCQYDGWFEYDGAKIWDIYGSFSYIINAECDGCRESFTFNNRTYWETEDVIVPCRYEDGYCAAAARDLSLSAGEIVAILFAIITIGVLVTMVGVLIWVWYQKKTMQQIQTVHMNSDGNTADEFVEGTVPINENQHTN